MKRVAAICLLLVSSAHADPIDCAATFPARLRDARLAIAAQEAYAAEFTRVMPWFYEHCRMLSPLEIAARHLDDQNAFVCDTQQGRPRGLTSRFVAEHTAEADVPAFQDLDAADLECRAADPVSLVMTGVPADDDASPAAQLDAAERAAAVLCYADKSPRCLKLRASLAAARARLSRSGA